MTPNPEDTMTELVSALVLIAAGGLSAKAHEKRATEAISRFNAERGRGVWVPREPTYAQWQRISTVLGDSLTDEETMEIYSNLLDVIASTPKPGEG